MGFKVGDRVRYVGTRDWSQWRHFIPHYKSLVPYVKFVLMDGTVSVGYPGSVYVWTQREGDRFIKKERGLYVNKRRSNATITSTGPNKSDGG